MIDDNKIEWLMTMYHIHDALVSFAAVFSVVTQRLWCLDRIKYFRTLRIKEIEIFERIILDQYCVYDDGEGVSLTHDDDVNDESR